MAFRLMILMAMGLGAMYMMHLLAQDYNKIRRPVAAAARALSSASAILMRGKRSAQQLRLAAPTQNCHDERNAGNCTTAGTAAAAPPPTIDWKRILSRDPFECLQSLICQIMSGAEGESREAILLMDFLESSLALAPAKIGRAFSRGLYLRGDTERCYNQYPFCLYSAKTMLRVLQWFSDAGYAE